MRTADPEEVNLNRIKRAERKKNSNLSFYLKGIAIAILSIASFEGGAYLKSQREYERERHIASELADYFGDNNGVTDKSEWISVYRGMGINYDEINPIRLDIAHLRQYNREMQAVRDHSPPRSKDNGNLKKGK